MIIDRLKEIAFSRGTDLIYRTAVSPTYHAQVIDARFVKGLRQYGLVSSTLLAQAQLGIIPVNDLKPINDPRDLTLEFRDEFHYIPVTSEKDTL